MANHQVYLPEEEGPFRCDHCEYFEQGNKCNQKNIIDYARHKMYNLTLSSDGLANVDPGGCSDYFERNSDMPISEYYKGSGDKVMKNMKKTYGKKKGKQVFYATANKNKLNVGPKK